MLKIISYNVNGIRAAMNKGLVDWLSKESPDIIHIQEVKALLEQVDIEPFKALGYEVYWFAAQKKGYSGVATFSKIKPKSVKYGIGHDFFDFEGRFLQLDFEDFSVINSYFPSGTTGDIRQEKKEHYLELVLEYCNEFRKKQPNFILSGDYNICHKPIDINHPERQNGVSGFLPEERAWLDQYEASGMVDSFRVFDQSAEKYSWWSYRAGARFSNAGWRIDYHWVSEPIRNRLKSASILSDAIHSDHCPVMVELE